MRRDQSAARADRCRRGLRPAEGRHARPGRVPGRAARGLRRSAGGRRSPATPRPRDRGRWGGRRRRLRAPGHPGRVRWLHLAPRHRPRDGGDRLPGAPGQRRPRHHRRGPHRRPDRVRQDGPGGRHAGGGGGRAVRRGRWRGRAGRDRGPGRASARWRSRSSNGRRPSRRRWPRASRRSSAAGRGSRGWSASARWPGWWSHDRARASRQARNGAKPARRPGSGSSPTPGGPGRSVSSGIGPGSSRSCWRAWPSATGIRRGSAASTRPAS